METIGIGIIGCGKIAQVRHLPEYAENPNARIVALYDVNYERAKKLISYDMIGQIITFRTAFGHSGPENWSIDPGKGTWFFDKNKAAMGVMADLGIHKTDLIQYLIGQDVVAVSSRVLTLHKTYPDGSPINVDDNAFCIYEMSGGAVGTLASSWTYYAAEDNSTVIFGTKGTMRIFDSDHFPIDVRNISNERIMFDVEDIQTNDNQSKSGVIDVFVDAIMNDTEASLDAKTVLPAMRAVFASIESSKKGCRIEIPENRILKQ